MPSGRRLERGALLAVALTVVAGHSALPGHGSTPGAPPLDRLTRPPFTFLYSHLAPEDVERLAARLRSRLPVLARRLAVEPPSAVTVLLLSADREEEFFAAAPGRPARWVQGFALLEQSSIVVRLRNLRGYPYQDAGSVAEHEMVHLLLGRGAGAFGPALPRWFHEGCAMLMARGWELVDWLRLAPAVLAGRSFPLSALAASFPQDEMGARLAYAESLSFVRFLVDRHGPGLPADLLEQVRAGAPFAEAYRRVSGRTLADAERAWGEEVNYYYRWLPALGSSLSLWALLSIVVVVGYVRKKRRVREILRRWEEEEGPGHPWDPGGWVH